MRCFSDDDISQSLTFCCTSNLHMYLCHVQGPYQNCPLLKETSIRGLSLSTPKLNSVSENAICCLWDRELIIVNGDQDMFVVSVLLQTKIYRYTFPLYVYKTTFSGKLSLHEDDEKIYGVPSFIFWTFTLMALFKYIFIVISANDNGEACYNGGYSVDDFMEYIQG
ncbi:uncharacterized protein LOC114257436 isoform X2 [Camellia sinensis]|uniref:uncharacterized protein LOC114257436 isoform X2 n=1 Tax=Camellia sinensis TaxID=4442 RepID=UPI001035C839|nr:uncharacterized protein LOC114257436 isoform X2 [Camellia sinensis]